MKNTIYVTGHKNPDSDSICAAIGYSELKNKLGHTGAMPVRLGDISKETKFILDYFGIEEPTFLETVKLQVADLAIDNISPIAQDISLKKAWSIMKKNNVKTLPIVDENECLMGIVSVSNLTSNYMDVWDNDILSKSNTSLENVIETLCGKAVCTASEVNLNGKIIVSAMQPESIKQIVEKGDIAICGDREDSQEMLIKSGISLLVITGNHPINEEIVALAKENNCSMISTPHDSFTTARLITQSIPVSYVMTTENLVYFSSDDFVDDIKDIMLETRYGSYPVVDSSNKVIGCISRYHLISKNKKKVILLDHNEKGQSVHGLDDAEILEIIDHHRLADIQTGNPIYFRNEPVGSTSTIVASMFFENGIRPSKKAAGALCSAIISDTLLFRSPTCTEVDKMIANRLSQIAKIDLEKFAKEMFKAGTSLDDRTAEQILHQDFKVFNINGMKIGVAQVNTMDLESFSSRKDEMLELMNDKVKRENFNLIAFMLTDILAEASLMYAAGPDKEVISRTYDKPLENDSVYLPGVLSRKKQVIPPITAAISK